jgi:GNAT superfamily N-acetyltransferase
LSVIIQILTESDLQSVDDLSRRYRNTLGFLTSETFRDYLTKKRVLGARTAEGELIGYLLFADYPDRFRIAQLCVADAFRGQGIARLLIEALKQKVTTQKIIKLRCRRDFPAHKMWHKLGFIPLDEKPGRSAQGHPLTLWCYRLATDDELGLWEAETSDEVLDVVIDAQIFYDFDAEDTTNVLISKGLLNDFLLDSLNLWITDELFLEIDRNKSEEVRKSSLIRAKGMARLDHREDLFQRYTELLKQILPYRSSSEKSDIHHIAKTAASDKKTFCTKDEKILNKANEIENLTGVTVIHPVELITSLHEISERHSYAPSRISGLNLHWQKMRSDDLLRLPVQTFQKNGETKGKLIESIRSFLAHPKKYRCEVLLSHSEISAIRVWEKTQTGMLLVHFARVSIVTDTKLISDFLIADTLSLAVMDNCDAVNFSDELLSDTLSQSLADMGFKICKNGWIKFALAKICRRSDAQKIISNFAPELDSEYSALCDKEFERDCAPLLSNESIPTYIVPIRPTFAMGLIDRKQAAEDLFGGDPSVLLRWDNVYYRKKSHHKMLQSPGRILWYVSGAIGAIVAISHIDNIEVDLPKELFRKYRKFGILEWSEIYAMCGNNIKQQIMAIRFSRTFLFKRLIPLHEIRSVFAQDGIKSTIQSPLGNFHLLAIC